MGRGVSYPHDNIAVAFGFLDTDMEWEDFVDNITSALTSRIPDLDCSDYWIGREDHEILKNGFVRIGLSEYCGTVALWALEGDAEPEHLDLRANAQLARIRNSIDEILEDAMRNATGKAFYRDGWFLKEIPA